jgi:hypothetical protein
MKSVNIFQICAVILAVGLLAGCSAAVTKPVIQAATMQEDIQQEVETALTAAPPLSPTETPRPTAVPTLTVEPGAAVEPSPEGPSDISMACANGGPGRVPYVDDLQGFCFLYPEDFNVEQGPQGITLFYGPAVDKNTIEPLRAAVTIEKVTLDLPKELEPAAAALWKESRKEFTVKQMTLGGEKALMGDNIVLNEPGFAVREALVFHKGTLYDLTFSPFDSTDPWSKALPDAQRAWDLITSTFSFIR